MSDATETRHEAISSEAVRPRPGVLIVFTEDRAAFAPLPVGIARVSTIGRDESATIVLDDSQASRVHVRLTPVEGGYQVEDLNSRNGSFIDSVRCSGSMRLPFGATLRLGRSLLLAVMDVEPHRARAADTLQLIGAGNIEALRVRIFEIAPRPEPALIEGETGVGKERVSQALHAASGRSGKLVAVNCAALPKELVEAELFGHAKGAFSGSERAREGLFRAAAGGTLLLDEVGDLPLEAQAKLLRVLETSEVRPVGEDRATQVDVRVVAATNAPLETRVKEGHFRSDLFHRLAAWRLSVPPLREHSEDVPALAQHFEPSARYSVEVMETLLAADWPGNVRELRNAVRSAVASAHAAGSSHVQPAHLPVTLALSSASRRSDDREADEVFRARVDTALRLRQGNVAQVARDLGVGRPWLYSVLKRLAIDPAAYRSGS
jgi:transcriptional regulator with GAF, ATPase, and Fis domain